VNDSNAEQRLKVCGEDLCETFERLEALHAELLEVLVAKQDALISVESESLGSVREEEENILHQVVDEEKQRLILTEEIGDIIGHPAPSTIRVTEMLDHFAPPLSLRLEESRDRLRDVAVRLGEKNRTNHSLIEHSLGHIQVFLSRLVNEEMMGAQYGADGSETSGDGGSMLMDRTG